VAAGDAEIIESLAKVLSALINVRMPSVYAPIVNILLGKLLVLQNEKIFSIMLFSSFGEIE
jgi:hypothetical protein